MREMRHSDSGVPEAGGGGINEHPLQVVFGAGQVGREVANQLAGLGVSVRAVSRRRPAGLAAGVDWRAADLTDAESAADAAKGASVVYQCLNVPYTEWPTMFPPLQRNVLAAAAHAEALLVSLENVYGYSISANRSLTEDLPLDATTRKGRTRAAMTEELLAASRAGRVRIAIGRASDFFGAGVTESTLGSRFFGRAVAGKRADFMGDPDLLHTYSYVPDTATGLITLGNDERAVGQVWHLPGPETVTTRGVLELVARSLGREVGLRQVPKRLISALGLVSPMMREVGEMSCEFDQPLVLDTSRYEAMFATAATPLASAVDATIAWYQAEWSAR
jgi:nucleoside-diphosphate-sugar epimerase